MRYRGCIGALVLALCLSAHGGVALAQATSSSNQDEAPATTVSPAEIQRMFDAYALIQAQDQLKLSDEQFAQFVARFKMLQEVRRRSQAERGRILRELARLTKGGQADDGTLREQLKALQDADARSALEIRKAYESVDQVLDVHQQVRFRLFEEMMERRKIELVTRAHRNNRLGAKQ